MPAHTRAHPQTITAPVRDQQMVGPRFYVIETAGFSVSHSRACKTPAVSYSVLDALWGHREVARFPVGHGTPDQQTRRARACELAAWLNGEDTRRVA